MRIGLVTAAYRPVQNGVTRLVSLYRKYLKLQGHDAVIFTYGDPDGSDQDGIFHSPGISVGQTGYSIGIRMSERALEELYQMDILHYHHPIMGLDLSLRNISTPVVFTNHTRYDLYAQAYLPLPSNISNRAMQKFWPKLVSSSDWIIAPSDMIANKLRELGVNQPIKVVRNGIELSNFSSPKAVVSRRDLGVPDDAVLLMYIGRLSPEKRVNELIDIVARAKELAPEIFLVLVGDGPARKPLDAEARKRSLDARFVGEVPFESVPNYLAAADIFVTASDSEVHPLTVIEAIAAGLPVIGRYESGLSETVHHGKNGFISSTGNEETAISIVELATNPELRCKMGATSQQMSRLFDIRQTVKQSIDIYRRLIEDGAGAAPESDRTRRNRFSRSRSRIQV